MGIEYTFTGPTKEYVDSLPKPFIIKRQADCTAALPSNTSTEAYVVVTTAGTGAVIGDLLRDNGSGVGTMEIATGVEGTPITVTDALTGGTVEFDADSMYIWDEDGSSWVKSGDLTSVENARGAIRIVIGTDATYSSTKLIPANARILSASLEVGTPYSATTTISIGYSGSVAAIMTTAENVPQTAATYEKRQDTAWDSSDRAVLVTVNNTPGAGAGVVLVEYAMASS